MIEIKKILYPTDFSYYAGHAQSYVVDLAKKFNAKVILLHVLMIPNYPLAYGIAIDNLSLEREVQNAARTRLHEVEVKLAAEGVEIETDLSLGPPFAAPFTAIIEASRRHEIDLIIMATHGHGAVKHMFLGSTAERVVRKAPCPVLTIRHPDHEFIHPAEGLG